jgi:hypothetical protein
MTHPRDPSARRAIFRSLSRVIGLALGLRLAMAVANPAPDDPVAELPPPLQRSVDFTQDVMPIFARSCHKCHGPERQRSSYRLDERDVALNGGSIGGAIVAGRSADSKLIRYVAGVDDRLVMPPKGARLSAEEIGILRAWIDQGAVWPATAKAAPVEAQPWWSLQEITSPPVPAVDPSSWVRNPIDAFVLVKLRAMGLSPAPEADRRTLIRRLTFDLIGLPPTPDETEAFVADPAADAYERLVDRLLSSPRHGERWARHWMDAVHFAETHGHDEDRPRPNAWPYRDYLVRSLNADKPYAQFVAEQLAGDVISPDDPDGVVALGFIAAGPWDESSQMGIVDGTTDKKIGQLLDRDDMLMTTMSTFVSTTVHCARCHDHKFDPIPQSDYYALQAVFAGVDRADRPYDVDPALHRQRQALLRRRAELSAAAPSPELLTPEVTAAAAAWEREATAGSNSWIVLKPDAFTEQAGTTAALQSDGSILFGGVRPERDIATITAHTPLERITAVRLVLLTDPSLPHEGPGRQDNGNLHLSEFTLRRGPASSAAGTIPVAIGKASADFNQEGYTIAHALDGDPRTAWGIFPEVGKSHAATFELREPLAAEGGGTTLTFVLEQLHGGGHLIGRPRLEVTSAGDPSAAREIPAAIAAILAVAPPLRTEVQQAELALHVLRFRVEEELRALPPAHLVYAATSDFKADGNFKPALRPREVHVLRRGDVNSPLDLAQPGALSCVKSLQARFPLARPDDEGERRAQLARWITDSSNPLTWRVIVNRVWHHHFGRGIVDTLDDFGHMGSLPTHPELLDWLALWFQGDGKQSLKALHRLIVTSSTFRQSSRYDERAASTDADNHFLWRMNRLRLDAEQIRDAVLQMSGKLDLTMGGPSVKQFIESPGIHVTPNVDYAGFDVDDPRNYRRSVYRFLFRTLPDPFMESLDCPDASQLAPVRTSSYTALQSLALLNDRFIVRQSEHVAERLPSAGGDTTAQVHALYQLVLQREPSSAEIDTMVAHAARYGMANVCRVLWNSSEFVFVE